MLLLLPHVTHTVLAMPLQSLMMVLHRRRVFPPAGLRAQFGSEFTSLAVLTPYKAQLSVLRRIFRHATGAAT